jgi:hypothetical protein
VGAWGLRQLMESVAKLLRTCKVIEGTKKIVKSEILVESQFLKFKEVNQ